MSPFFAPSYDFIEAARAAREGACSSFLVCLGYLKINNHSWAGLGVTVLSPRLLAVHSMQLDWQALASKCLCLYDHMFNGWDVVPGQL